MKFLFFLVLMSTGVVHAETNLKCSFQEVTAKNTQPKDLDVKFNPELQMQFAHSVANPDVFIHGEADSAGNIGVTVFDKKTGVSAANHVGPGNSIQSKVAAVEFDEGLATKSEINYRVKCSLP